MDLLPQRQPRQAPQGEPGGEDDRDHQAGERPVEGDFARRPRPVGRQGGRGQGALRDGDVDLRGARAGLRSAEEEEGEVRGQEGDQPVDGLPQRQPEQAPRGEPGGEDDRYHQDGERCLQGALGRGARRVDRDRGG